LNKVDKVIHFHQAINTTVFNGIIIQSHTCINIHTHELPFFDMTLNLHDYDSLSFILCLDMSFLVSPHDEI